MSEPVAIKFTAEVRQTKTMADHTYNVTLNIPEYHGDEASWFLKHQLELVECVVVIKPIGE